MRFTFLSLTSTILSLIAFHVVSQSLKENTEVFVILLKNYPPSPAFDGNSELRRTAPIRSSKLDTGSPHVISYSKFLELQHQRLLESVKINPTRIIYSYKHVLNGFAIALNSHETLALKSHPEVGSVVRSHHCFPHTTHTPDFLNIPKTLWRDAGGTQHAGEDIIIGIIDTGINPDHPSFSDQVSPPYESIERRRPWRGHCFLGDKNFTCNKKLIGAKFFVAGLLAEGDTVDLSRDAYSPRDFNGHGSHTASTAGGNHDVPVDIPGVPQSLLGRASGMAPRARISAYKGLWYSGQKYPGGDYGTVVDLLAALEEAVSDGVDVVNYSIGPSDDFFDLWALGVLYAAKAGVFVSASAGNAGPEPVTLGHVAPWYLAVAASTHDREYVRELTLGNGEKVAGEGLLVPFPQGRYVEDPFSVLSSNKRTHNGISSGGSLDDSEVEAPLIAGRNGAVSLNKSDEAEYCLKGSLDPLQIKGKIVVCKRGYNGRVEKGKVVRDAGGVGFVLWNDSPEGGLVTDLHFIPGLHVTYSDGLTVLKYINYTNTPRGSISKQLTFFNKESPEIIDFSSRGPISDATVESVYPLSNDVLKPDVAAPGVSIWAGFAPGGDPRQLSFNLLSGTSMASPHVAGVGALIKQAHPDWSPYWIKSAIQTTANLHTMAGEFISGIPFDFGSGQIVPSNATDPGLIFPSHFNDYVEFLYFSSYEKALSLSGVPPPTVTRKPRDINTPNIAIANLTGTVTVQRVLRNVAGQPENYTCEVRSPEGVDVSIQPVKFAIFPGKEVSFSITLSVEVTSKEFKFGSITWISDKHIVRSQLAVQPWSVS